MVQRDAPHLKTGQVSGKSNNTRGSSLDTQKDDNAPPVSFIQKLVTSAYYFHPSTAENLKWGLLSKNCSTSSSHDLNPSMKGGVQFKFN